MRDESHEVTRLPRSNPLTKATGADEVLVLWSSRAGRVLVSSVLLIAVATVIGLVALWPAGSGGRNANDSAPTLAAQVSSVRDEPCPGAEGPAAQLCRELTVDPVGRRTPGTINIGPAEGGLSVGRGDRVRVSLAPSAEGLPDGFNTEPYTLVGIDHSRQVLIAALLLAIFAWWRSGCAGYWRSSASACR